MLTTIQIEQYQEQGYLILKNWISDFEIQRMRDDVQALIEHAPKQRNADTDRNDNPVANPKDFAFTDLPDGRQVLNRISRQLAHSETMRQVYGNPKLLSTVEAIYGPDFLPFAESIVIKMPEDGAPFPWHQDGQFKTGPQPERGINFGIYLYPSTEQNGCLYVIPGSHKKGRINLPALIEKHGERLPDAVPMPAEPGDLVIHSRNLVHGSFPNTSPDLRITVYFGFHARTTVEHIYAPEHIHKREAIIPHCIHERKSSGLYANETPYTYRPLPETPTNLSLSEILQTPALTV